MTGLLNNRSQSHIRTPRRPMTRLPGVLIADGSEGFLSALTFGLHANGFTVWPAGDGIEALELFILNQDLIDVVLLDVRMAGRDGPRTLGSILRLAPETLACFLTDDSLEYTEDQLLELGAARVLRKPIGVSEIARELREVLDAVVPLTR